METIRTHFEEKDKLAKQHKFGDFLQDDADVLMALDTQYDGVVLALQDRMKKELQEVVAQIVEARHKIDWECEQAHQKYLSFHAKKLVYRATRIQNETVRKEVEKALAQDEMIQNQHEQIKMLTEVMKLLMNNRRCKKRAATWWWRRRQAQKQNPTAASKSITNVQRIVGIQRQKERIQTHSPIAKPIILGQTKKADHKRQKAC